MCDSCWIIAIISRQGHLKKERIPKHTFTHTHTAQPVTLTYVYVLCVTLAGGTFSFSFSFILQLFFGVCAYIHWSRFEEEDEEEEKKAAIRERDIRTAHGTCIGFQ